MSQPTLSQSVASLKDQLLAAMCQKADAEATIAQCRAALTGIQMATQAAPEVPVVPPAPPVMPPTP
jgi:hypothetical protein